MSTGKEKYQEEKKMTEQKLALSVEEMAEELGISKPVAYELIKREGFPSIRVSERRIIIPRDALREWLNANSGLSVN